MAAHASGSTTPTNPMARRPKWYRQKLIINKSFQIKYTLIVTVLCTLIYGILGYFFFKSEQETSALLEIQNMTLQQEVAAEDYGLLIYLIAFYFLQLSSLLFLGTLFTHRVAGPLFRITKVIEEWSKGHMVPVGQLRKRDEFKEVVPSFNNLSDYIKTSAKNDVFLLDKIESKIHSFSNEFKDNDSDLLLLEIKKAKEQKKMIFQSSL